MQRRSSDPLRPRLRFLCPIGQRIRSAKRWDSTSIVLLHRIFLQSASHRLSASRSCPFYAELNHVFFRFVFLVLASVGAIGRAATPPDPSGEPLTAKELRQGYRDHVLLVKPRAPRRASAESEEQREGMRVRRRWDRFDGLRLLEVRPGETIAQAIERLRATGRYEYVHPDTIRYATTTPNDPSFFRQWSLSNTGTNNGLVGADIKATAAWDVRTDASSVIVAVIDSGVKLDHPDISANLWVNQREFPAMDAMTTAMATWTT